MSALHEAVDRAIAGERVYPPGGVLSESEWRECEAAAAAAIRVVLAEVERSIEALDGGGGGDWQMGYVRAVDDALGVLAALREQA